MKTMLVIGGTKGIGKGCADYFKNKNYNIITVARSNADINGDICDLTFQEQLINSTTPDILINSAGQVGTPLNTALNINYSAAAQLITKFYLKMAAGGHIVNVSSIAANNSKGNKGIPLERISYNTSKRAISDFCISLAQSKHKDVKVTTLEPELVYPTNFLPTHRKTIDKDLYDNYMFNAFLPLRPLDIATTIDWIISQPRWMNISSVTINNHFNSKS